MIKQFKTVKDTFEFYGWCKKAFARDRNDMGIPAINIPIDKPQPVAFSLTGAIHFVYHSNAILVIYRCRDYLEKQYKHQFTVDEWQDNQPDFTLIAKLIKDLEI